jgi:hypothetical protein
LKNDPLSEQRRNNLSFAWQLLLKNPNTYRSRLAWLFSKGGCPDSFDSRSSFPLHLTLQEFFPFSSSANFAALSSAFPKRTPHHAE